MRHWIVKWSPLFLFLGLLAFMFRGLYLNPQLLPSTQIGKPLPCFSLPVLGHSKEALNSEEIKGQISLLNVWASWCGTCSEEQSFLMQLAEQGMVIYGLNYKDNPKEAKIWLQTFGDPYRMVVEDREGTAAIDLGVYGTPETFLLDSEGIIRYRHAGALNAEVWKEEFLPVIESMQRKA